MILVETLRIVPSRPRVFARGRGKSGKRMSFFLAVSLAVCVAMGSSSTRAQEEPTFLLVDPAPAAELVAFEALVGNAETETATDFGFLQPSEDGWAIRAVRTRVGPDGLAVASCVGGLAPASLDGLFEGAYACGEEEPVPLSYQPEAGKLLPNLVDPNGVWEDEAFFVSSALSIKVSPARAVAIPAEALRPLSDDAPNTLDGLVGRPAPPHIQASGVCGADIAVFFPLAGLPACADAARLDQD